MKIRKSVIILIFGVASLLSIYSIGVVSILVIVGVFIFLTLIALLITLCTTVFFKGTFKQRFIKGLPLSFILTGTTYIIGYFFKTILILCV